MSLKPSFYDSIMKVFKRTKIDKARKDLISQAHGHVLEIGSGTGLNFPLYNNVTHVTAIEPDTAMRNRSIAKKETLSIPITTYNAKAESLPFQNAMFDTVVSTLVFCTVSDPLKSIQEIIRVAKEDATILFLEHVKMKQPFVAKLQHFATPIWRRLADGCHLNRDTLQLIEQSGLNIVTIDQYYKGLFIAVVCKNLNI